MFALSYTESAQRKGVYYLNFNSITIIGRDNRILVAKKLLEENGINVFHITDRNILSQSQLCNITVLPIPYKDASGKIKGSDIFLHDIQPLLCAENFIILGKADNEIKSLADRIKFGFCDINEDLRFKKLNAVPTAEAAINIAMQNTPYTLNKRNILICGYGCIARCLAKISVSLGCNITVAARKKSDRIDAEYCGCKTINFDILKDNVGSQDIIFNTCPAQTLTKDVLARVKHDCIIIDLASHPGGCDFEYARRQNLNAGLYLSLPDIYSPQTSGENLYKTICDIIADLKNERS